MGSTAQDHKPTAQDGTNDKKNMNTPTKTPLTLNCIYYVHRLPYSIPTGATTTPTSAPMNEDLADEVSALNSIYGDTCITPSGSGLTYVLRPPTTTISPQLTLTLSFPENYPHAPPMILDGAGGGGVAKKDLARDVLRGVWREGEVCLYDLVEGMRELLDTAVEEDGGEEGGGEGLGGRSSPLLEEDASQVVAHPWTVVDPLVEKKSVFIARAIEVHSVEDAKRYVADLVAGDKKIAKATHNMTGICMFPFFYILLLWVVCGVLG